MGDDDGHLRIGYPVELVGLTTDVDLEGCRGRVVDAPEGSPDCVVELAQDGGYYDGELGAAAAASSPPPPLLGLVDRRLLEPTSCGVCGVDAAAARALLARTQAEVAALQADAVRLRRVADAHAADAAAQRDETARMAERLAEAEAAACRRSEHLEAAMNEAVARCLGGGEAQAAAAATATAVDDAAEERLVALQETADSSDRAAGRLAAAVASCGESGHAAALEARGVFDGLCEAFRELSLFVGAYTVPNCTHCDEPEFVTRVQTRRLGRAADSIAGVFRAAESCHGWLGNLLETADRPPPAPLPPAPLPLLPGHQDPELGAKPSVTFAPDTAGGEEELPRLTTAEELEARRSTTRQRFMGSEKENHLSHPYRGKTHLISICLDYKGTQSPLNCCVDGDRIVDVARRAGVKDVTKVYDNGEEALYPSMETVLRVIKEVGERCAKGDFLVIHYSGHGGSVEDLDGDEETGFDQTLCLRNEATGEVEQLVDDDFSLALAQAASPEVGLLVLADACHSGTLLDLGKDELWKEHKQVVSISGCQDTQCSTDTGDGGAMTNAFLRVVKGSHTRELRKKRRASVQYIFNRMVDAIKEPSPAAYDVDAGSEWSEDGGNIESDDGSETNYEDILMAALYGIEPGQHMTLSWNANCDPTTITFPF